MQYILSFVILVHLCRCFNRRANSELQIESKSLYSEEKKFFFIVKQPKNIRIVAQDLKKKKEKPTSKHIFRSMSVNCFIIKKYKHERRVESHL